MLIVFPNHLNGKWRFSWQTSATNPSFTCELMLVKELSVPYTYYHILLLASFNRILLSPLHGVVLLSLSLRAISQEESKTKPSFSTKCAWAPTETSSTMPGLETRRDDRTEKRIADKAKPQGHATFKQQDPWVFSCKHQPKRNIYKIMGQNKTSSQILHSACGKPKRDDFCKTLFRSWFLENNTKRDDFSSSLYGEGFSFEMSLPCPTTGPCLSSHIWIFLLLFLS